MHVKSLIRRGLLPLSLAGAMVMSVPAQAETLLSTEALVAETTQQDLRADISAQLARDDIAEQLTAWGVDAATIDMRLAQLSEQELQAFANQLDEAPAGAGALAVVGVVFVVLLVLELFGVINVFNAI
ncbi:PA2779 family protein [Polycyclovorans algicola]|uniref:PA2779 family protein n=1 Tax=Polycyclovorans algicola TaxID=616992 RepID=UPI0005B84F56|nr:PA2779 family protein [Polycyclovorans algicola]